MYITLTMYNNNDYVHNIHTVQCLVTKEDFKNMNE